MDTDTLFTIGAAVEIAGKTTAALALAGTAAVLAGRHSSAAQRHNIWMMGLYATLLIPLLMPVLPRWHVFPEPGGGQPGVARSATPRETGGGVAAAGPARTSGGDQPEAGGTTVTLEAAGAPGAVVEQQATVFAPPVPGGTVRFPSRADGRTRVQWWAALWGGGIMFLFGRIAVSRIALARLGARSRRVEAGPLRDELEAAQRLLGMRRSVTLFLSETRAMPMSWGFFTTAVLLPEDASTWRRDRLRSVLLHELAHLRRADPLHRLLAQVACALHWYNPLVWVAAWRLQVERERAADDRVLGAGVLGSDYATHLLDVVSRSQPLPLAAGSTVSMASSPSQLERRIAAAVDPRHNRRPVSLTVLSCSLLAAGSSALPVAMAAKTDSTAAGGNGGRPFELFDNTPGGGPAAETATATPPSESAPPPTVPTSPTAGAGEEAADEEAGGGEKRGSAAEHHQREIIAAWVRLVAKREELVATLTAQYQQGTVSFDALTETRRSLSESRLGLARAKHDRRAELKAIEDVLRNAEAELAFMKQQFEAGIVSVTDLNEREAAVLETQVLLAESNARHVEAAGATPSGSDPTGGHAASLARLSEELAMLEANRAAASVNYGAKHPKILQLDAQVRALRHAMEESFPDRRETSDVPRGRPSTGRSYPSLEEALLNLRSDRQELLTKLDAAHPAVARMDRRIADLRDELARWPSAPDDPTVPGSTPSGFVTRAYNVPGGRSAQSLVNLVGRLSKLNPHGVHAVQNTSGSKIVLEATPEFHQLVGEIIDWGGARGPQPGGPPSNEPR